MSGTRLGTILAFALGSLVAAVPAGAANHIPGATYNGTDAQGGAVSLTVTPDGSGVSSFSDGGPIHGSTCTYSSVGFNFVQPVAIVNDAFSYTSSMNILNGSFPGAQSASGTLRLKSPAIFPAPSCDTGDVAWSATTTATPPAPTPQPTLTPQTGTGTVDTIAPVAVLSGKTTQKVGKFVSVDVSSPAEPCTASAKGTVNVPGAAKTYKLTGASAHIAKGGKATLKLKVPSKVQKAIKSALANKRKVKAKITATMTDAAGNKTTKTRNITLRR